MKARLALWTLLLVGVAHCQRRDDLRGLQLLSVVSPDTTCSYTAASPFISTGLYDPAVPGASSYGLGLRVKNNLGGQVDLLSGFSGTMTSSSVEYHPLQIQSVETCWFVADESTSMLGAQSGQPLVPCDQLPDTQRATVTATGFMEGGGGESTVQLSVLDLAQLRAVFGSSFSPQDIPSQGSEPWIVPSGGGNVILQYSFSPSDAEAAASSRASAWGEKYPRSAEAQIIYQMRVTARGPGNSSVSSNWLSFPITVCPKCVLAQCGSLVQKICAKGPCSDGTPCLSNGQCGNGNLTCAPTTLFSGSVPDFGTPAMCLPAQRLPGTTPPLCTKVGCDL